MTAAAHRYPADIRPLTSLRFFAAMAVVIYHFSYFIPSPWVQVSGVLQDGYLAVDFFFILSGFILTHAYIDGVREGSFSGWQFVVRRFARIYPMHLLTLLVMIPIAMSPLQFGPAGYWPGHFPLHSLITNILLIHGWGIEPTLSFNLPSWSISAEWFAYLTFPLWLTQLLKVRPIILLATVTAFFFAFWFGWHAISPHRPLTRLSADCSILRIMPEFTIGIALYLFCARKAKQLSRSGWLLGFIGLIIAAALHFRTPDVAFIPLFIAAIYAAAELSRRADGGGWIAKRPFVWLGEISYGIYMVHYVVMLLVLWSVFLIVPHDRYLHLLPILLPAVPMICIAVAGLCFSIYEKPARKLITEILIHRRLASGKRHD